MHTAAIIAIRPASSITLRFVGRRLAAKLRRAFELAGAPYAELGYRYL